MRVLLVPQKSNYPDPSPCMHIIGQGFPYIAASLKAAGHDIFVANLNYRWCPDTAAAALEETLREAIAEYQPDLIGIGGLSADYPFVKDAIRFGRKIAPDTPIVCGGGIMTYDPEFIFKDLRPDFGVVGEAAAGRRQAPQGPQAMSRQVRAGRQDDTRPAPPATGRFCDCKDDTEEKVRHRP